MFIGLAFTLTSLALPRIPVSEGHYQVLSMTLYSQEGLPEDSSLYYHLMVGSVTYERQITGNRSMTSIYWWRDHVQKLYIDDSKQILVASLANTSVGSGEDMPPKPPKDRKTIRKISGWDCFPVKESSKDGSSSVLWFSISQPAHLIYDLEYQNGRLVYSSLLYEDRKSTPADLFQFNLPPGLPTVKVSSQKFNDIADSFEITPFGFMSSVGGHSGQ